MVTECGISRVFDRAGGFRGEERKREKGGLGGRKGRDGHMGQDIGGWDMVAIMGYGGSLCGANRCHPWRSNDQYKGTIQ